jgi:hypothetical protein
MAKAVQFTQAQVRRAVKAAESAGLCVKRIIVNQDGSIVVDSGETAPRSIDSPDMALASWDDA